MQNFLYAHDFVKGNLPTTFNNNTFKLTHNVHNYNTRGSSQHQISLPRVKAQVYVIKSIKYQAIDMWNKYVSKFPQNKFYRQSKTTCKKMIRKYFIESY